MSVFVQENDKITGKTALAASLFETAQSHSSDLSIS